MILSLEINHQKDLDVISFFPVENAVHCSQDLWFEVLTSSLKMKHSVLIRESENDLFPVWNNSQRWQTGDNWCWLHPRALSTITQSYPTSFNAFKTLLMNSK